MKSNRVLHEKLASAIGFIRNKQLGAAELALSSILKRWPTQGDALHFLGVLRHQQGDSKAAIALIQQAITVLPREAGALNNLGNVFVEIQQFDNAEKAYLDCLKLHPDRIDVLNNLSTIYHKRGLHEDAESLCRRAIAAKPDFAQAWYNLSLSLLAQKRIHEGLIANSHAVLLMPKHQQARNSVARALVTLGRLDEASQLYRQWLEDEPDNPMIQHHLAACSGHDMPQRASNAYVERTFDAFAATFDVNLIALGYRAPQLVADLVQEVLRAHNRVAEKLYAVADLGCGTGLCGPLLRPFSHHLSGCDLSAGMLEKANLRLVYDALHHLELVDFLRKNVQNYDIVVCADTFCYFGSLSEAVAACGQALQSSGLLVFTVEALTLDNSEPYRLQTSGRYAHQREYIDTILRQNGFTLYALRLETLRMEAGKSVQGWLVAATACSTSQNSKLSAVQTSDIH